MHIIIGGTGTLGSEVGRALLARGEPVTVVTRDEGKAETWRLRGAKASVVNLFDSEALRAVLRRGDTAFVLNPPADPNSDTDAEEHRSVDALLAALRGSGLRRIVAQSTYGVTRGSGIGDLGTLERLEAGLAEQPIPYAIQRAAYLMSNWAMAAETARSEGIVNSFFPADFVLPMVAPEDLGRSAADLLTADEIETIRNVEGPERYSPQDVAAAFAKALGRDVTVTAADPKTLEDTFGAIGFSETAARSYAGMTRLAMTTEPPKTFWRGRVTLDAYITGLVENG